MRKVLFPYSLGNVNFSSILSSSSIISVLSRTNILPIETQSPSESGLPSTTSTKVFVYHGYEYNAPYNVKIFNPDWFTMTGAGKAYELCGAMCDDEFKRALRGFF